MVCSDNQKHNFACPTHAPCSQRRPWENHKLLAFLKALLTFFKRPWQLLFEDLWGREGNLISTQYFSYYFSAISPLQLIKDSGEQALRQAMLQVVTDFRTCSSGFGWAWTGRAEKTGTRSLQHCLLFSWSLKIRRQQPTQACKGQLSRKAAP